MAWEWSHTQEAYDNAKLNIEDLDVDTLAVVVAEIAGKDFEDNSEELENFYTSGPYEKALKEAKEKSQEELATKVWAFAEEYSTCDNGGFNAYICPYGCHTVSFDRDDE